MYSNGIQRVSDVNKGFYLLSHMNKEEVVRRIGTTTVQSKESPFLLAVLLCMVAHRSRQMLA